MFRLLRKMILVVFICCICFVGYATWSVWDYGKEREVYHADAAIVLGAAEWNGKPSPVYEQRILHGISLFQEEKVDKLIFTGGKGTGSDFSEAEAGRNFAIEQGVPAHAILIENESQVTQENLRNAKSLVDQQGLESVVLVSDPYHMKRASLLAEYVGLDAQPSPTPTSAYQTNETKIPFFIKEVVYVMGYMIAFPAESILGEDNDLDSVVAKARTWVDEVEKQITK